MINIIIIKKWRKYFAKHCLKKGILYFQEVRLYTESQ